MFQGRGKPKRLGFVSAVIAANGLLSLWSGYVLATTYPTDLAGASASIVIGVLLLHRAYALWMLHRLAWEITIALISLQAASAVAELARGYRSPNVWFSVFLLSAALFYMLTPGVRRLYARQR